MDIHDLQATVTAGSCSSRVIFNVPKARSAGVELEFDAAPNRNFDFAISAQLQQLRAALDAHLDRRRAASSASSPASRRDGACRPCPSSSSPRPPRTSGRCKPGTLAYVTGTYQHIGSRFTQVGDQTDLGTLDLLSFGANTIGGPLTASTFTYDPELPAYDLAQPARRRPSQRSGTSRSSSTT